MEEEPDHGQHLSSPSSTSFHGPSNSSVSTSQVEEEEQEEENDQPEHQHHHRHHHHHNHQEQPQSSGVSYRLNISISDVAASGVMRDDVWSCLIVLVTFWFFASMTMILGFYGSMNLQLGPYCSRLIQTNPFFVQSIKVQATDEPKPGPMLYGFYEPPPLDVEITWSETHKAVVPMDFHKEWLYFLNKGSKVDIFYNVKSSSSLPLSLVITQGRENLVQWIEDPSYPNTTLSWYIISGSGKVQQEISKSYTYYIALGNLNSEEVEVELRFILKASTYNTSQAYYRCSLGNRLCSLKLFLLGTSVAVLTSPSPKEGASVDDWYVKLSYGPRWTTYFLGSGVMTILVILVFKFCKTFQNSRGDGYRAEVLGSERAPLLSPKDDDFSSWGSSYESISHDEEDLDEWLAVNSLEGEKQLDREQPPRMCVICFDSPRDCFFLPCGHCATCFTCGSRIAEEAGICPICRRSMKKVRKIFTV